MQDYLPYLLKKSDLAVKLCFAVRNATKVLLLVLVSILMFILSACGDENASKNMASSASRGQQIIVKSATIASQEQVQKAYIAYYGRPADPDGLSYWAGELDAVGGDWSAIIYSFGNSDEATSLLSGLSNEQKIDKLYTQAFGRSADTIGRSYYANGLANGTFNLASLAVNIINGAVGSDAITVYNKVAAAKQFTANLNNSNIYYYNSKSVVNVRNSLASITNSPANSSWVDDAIATMVSSGTVEKSALTSKTWKATAITINPAYNGISNLYAIMDNCNRDDLLVYSSSDVAIGSEGESKCSAYDPDVYFYKSWSLFANLLFVADDIFEVIELSDNKLTTRVTFILNNTVYTLTETYISI